MAASAAASVVWLTADASEVVPVSRILGSAGAAFADFAAGLDSGFLVVTETFDCTLADFTAAMDEFFPAVFAFDASTVAFDPFAEDTFNSLFFAEGFLTDESVAFAEEADAAVGALVLRESVFPVFASIRDGAAADFPAAVFVSFAGSIKGFAGFIIAFAKVSTTG